MTGSTTPGDNADEASSTSLGSLIGRGLGWSFAGQIINRIGIFGSGIVLARLLTREDFGVYAVALVVLNILGAINELGVIPAIVRWQGDLRAAVATGTTLATGFSLILYGLIFIGAPTFAEAMNAPDATGVLRLLGLTIIVDGMSGASQALLHRSFIQDRQTLAETLGMVVYVVVAVVLAVGGAGPWSIAWGRVLGSIVTGSLFARYAPFRCRPGFDPAVAREMLRFGVPLALSALVAEAVLNVDYVIVGQTLGPVNLGIYLLAFNLSSWPVSTVSMAVAKVAFAGFSRLVGDRERLQIAVSRSFGLALTGTVPLVLILGVLAPEVVGVVYGDKWLPAATAVRFLLVLGGLRVVQDLLFDVIAADGRSRANLRVRLAWLVVLVPALLLGAELDGIRGVGIAHMAVSLAVVTPLLLSAGRLSGIGVRPLASQALRPLAAGGVALAAMLAVLPVASGDIVRLGVVGATGGLVYVAALLPGNALLAGNLGRLRAARSAP